MKFYIRLSILFLAHILLANPTQAAGKEADRERQILFSIMVDDLSGTGRQVLNKAQVNVQDEEGKTTLIWASFWGQENIAKFLVQVPGIDVNIQDKDGLTALMHAAQEGHENIVKLLLDAPGINIDIQDKTGHTALDHASKHDNTFKILTQAINIDLLKSWFKAIESGDQQTVLKLIEKIDVNAQNQQPDKYHGYTALILASQNGHEHIVKFLLQVPKINVNSGNNSGTTALMMAALYGHLNIIKLLVQASEISVNIQNDFGNTALMYGLHKKDVTELLAQCPEIDVNIQDQLGRTAFIHAAASNTEYSETIVKILLKAPNININIQDNKGKTALIHAIANGNNHIAELLLQMPGINIDAETSNGKTAYSMACEKPKRSNLAKLILQKRAELPPKAFQAVSDGDLITLKNIVISLGPRILDAEDKSGDTLLHKAFLKNSTDIIILLLRVAQDARESLCKKNKNGQIPLELITPTSPIFLFCMDLAFAPKIDILSQTVNLLDTLTNFRKTEITSNSCAHCSLPNCTARCSQCRKVYYCSPECQKSHWKQHKRACNPVSVGFEKLRLTGLL